jgi:hypothetical protein
MLRRRFFSLLLLLLRLLGLVWVGSIAGSSRIISSSGAVMSAACQ